MQEKSIKEIKSFIKDMANTILDAMQVKGFSRAMINNQLEGYLDDSYNDTDIEISYYTLLEKLKEYNLLKNE